MTISTNSEKKQYSNNFTSHQMGIGGITVDFPEMRIAGSSAILARTGIPSSHIKIADNYMIIKRIYGYPLVQSKITKEEKELLLGYNFNVLEYSNYKQIEEELSFLKKWSVSRNDKLQEDADKILETRSKELKYLIATNFVDITNRNSNGFIALDRYFSNISKYFRKK